MDELSVRQASERAQAMREHEADMLKEAKDQQRIKDALKHYGAYWNNEKIYFYTTQNIYFQ